MNYFIFLKILKHLFLSYKMASEKTFVTIPTHPNYEINKLGEIRNAKTWRLVRILDCESNKYNFVELSVNKKRKTFRRDVLLMQTFKPDEEIKELLNHKNGDLKDDSLDNLEWKDKEVVKKSRYSRYNNIIQTLPENSVELVKCGKNRRHQNPLYWLPKNTKRIEEYEFKDLFYDGENVYKKLEDGYFPYAPKTSHNQLAFNLTDKNGVMRTIPKIWIDEEFPQFKTEPTVETKETKETKEVVNSEGFVTLNDFPSYEINKEGVVKNITTKKEIKLIVKKNALPYYMLIQNGKPKSMRRNVLLAQTFVENPNPEKFKDVKHKDGNNRNDAIDNLEWYDSKDFKPIDTSETTKTLPDKLWQITGLNNHLFDKLYFNLQKDEQNRPIFTFYLIFGENKYVKLNWTQNKYKKNCFMARDVDDELVEFNLVDVYKQYEYVVKSWDNIKFD